MKQWLGLTVCFVALSLPAYADLCVAPRQQDVNPKKTPIPLCLVAKKVALTPEQYNDDPSTLKPSSTTCKTDFNFNSHLHGGFSSAFSSSRWCHRSILIHQRRHSLLPRSLRNSQKIPPLRSPRFF